MVRGVLPDADRQHDGLPRIPFAGVVHTIMDHRGDGRSRDEVLGPVRARVNARFGHGDLPADARARASVGIVVGALRHLVGGWFRRAHTPSPFFEATGEPIAEPTIVAADERERIRSGLGS